jgi:pyruvate/2-oxoacid:ferredoxin oxidoreductase beta subunit
VAKFFGMYLYVDKFDYCINNLNNEDIEEEADAIEEKLKGIEENSILFYKSLKNKIKKEQGSISTDFGSNKKIDLSSGKVLQNRYDNLTNQIFTLQMKQLSESIWNIKKDLKNNTYILGFDSNENIQSITLNESQYKDLLKFRDPLNSVSVYDLFQEKIFSYYNGSTGTGKVDRGRGVPSPIGKELTFTEKKKRGRKPKKRVSLILDEQSTYIPDEALPDSDTPTKKKRGRKKKVEIKRGPGRKKKLVSVNRPVKTAKGRPPRDEVEIAKFVNINYDFCHHCKQRKPAEVMVRCCSSSCSKFVERPVKNFLVNNTTCVRSK